MSFDSGASAAISRAALTVALVSPLLASSTQQATEDLVVTVSVGMIEIRVALWSERGQHLLL